MECEAERAALKARVERLKEANMYLRLQVVKLTKRVHDLEGKDMTKRKN